MQQLILGVYAEEFYRELLIGSVPQTLGPLPDDTVCIPSLPGRLLLTEHDSRPLLIDQGAGLRISGKLTPHTLLADGDVYSIGLEGWRQFLTVRAVREDAAEISVLLPEDRSVTIGRVSASSIRYEEAGVSGRHAEIAPLGGGQYRVTDLGSTNGTYVNGMRVTTLQLEKGDYIVIYGHRIRFEPDHLVLDTRFLTPHIQRLKHYLPGSAQRYPIVRVAPRLLYTLPTEAVDIPPPAHKPNQPALSMLLTAIPMTIMALVSVYMFLEGRRDANSLLYTLPMLLASGGVALINYLLNRYRYKRQTQRRIDLYRETLTKLDATLKEIWNDQRKYTDLMQPELSRLLNAIEKQNELLWQRRSLHPDFLTLRLGVGTRPFCVPLRLPSGVDSSLEIDQLRELPEKLKQKYQDVPGVPIPMSLTETPIMGIVGEHEQIQAFAQELLLQLCALHAYDELRTALLFSRDAPEAWEFARWLPHMWSEDRRVRRMANDPVAAAAVVSDIGAELKRRESALTSVSQQDRRFLPHMLLLLADPSLVENNTALQLIQSNGKALGASVWVLASALDELPLSCDCVIELGPDTGKFYRTGAANAAQAFRREKLSGTPAARLETLLRLSRKLAPKRVSTGAEAGLPTNYSFFQMYGVHSASELDAAGRWAENRTYLGIHAPIGVLANGEVLELDLIHNGPHGLVAGTTGSGKSELLASFLLSLALNYSPHDLIMMVIDFKGAALAEQLKGLPHLVGQVSDLSGNEVLRALKSIKSELRMRSSVFMNYRDESGKVINNIRDYRALRDVRGQKGETSMPPLPHLLIVVDEFQQLKKEQPEFMKELISVAITGRSLGVHMILSTQKPAGVVDAAIWANTRFRICLRMQDEADSREVIRRPDASKIVNPGRAYLQIGDDEFFDMIQSAYASMRLSAEQTGDAQHISLVNLSGQRTLVKLEPTHARFDVSAPTQLQGVIEHIRQAAEAEGLEPLPGPWRNPLPAKLPITGVQRLPKDGWNSGAWKKSSELIAIAGMVDDPDRQQQMVLSINFTQNAHFAIFGAPGTGKKMLLLAIATSLLLQYGPKDLHLYCLDMGDRSLRLLSGFPQVGDVVFIEEGERVTRLIRMLRREVTERKQLLSRHGDASLLDYRRRTGKTLPYIVFIIDEYATLKDAYEPLVEDVVALTGEGAEVGVYVVLTAVLFYSVGVKLMANIKQAASLAQTDRAAYTDIVGNPKGVFPENIPGRGLLRGEPPLIFQTAHVAEDGERVAVYETLRTRMQQAAEGVKAKPVPSMPEILYLPKVLETEEVHATLKQTPDRVIVGMDMQDMMPVYFNPFRARSILVASPLGGGKTSALRLLIVSMMLRRGPERLRFVLLDSASLELYGFQGGGHIWKYATLDDADGVRDALSTVHTLIEERKAKRKAARLGNAPEVQEEEEHICLVVHDINEFVRSASAQNKEMLAALIGQRALHANVIAAGNLGDLSSFEPPVRALREAQTGLLLGAHVLDYATLFNVRTPSNSRVFLEGEGFLVPGNGTTQRIRLAYLPPDAAAQWAQALS